MCWISTRASTSERVTASATASWLVTPAASSSGIESGRPGGVSVCPTSACKAIGQGPPSALESESEKSITVPQGIDGSSSRLKCGRSLADVAPLTRSGQVANAFRIVTPGVGLESVPLIRVWIHPRPGS